EIEPANVSALRAKAEILAKQGHTEELEVVLNQLEQASPDTGLGAFGKGRLYKSQKKYAEAVVEYEKALQHEPGSILALNELVNTEIAMGNADGAIERVKGVLEEDPEHQVAHDLLGLAYVAKEDFTAAEAAFVKQSEVNPKSNVVYLQIAGARAKQGDMEGAVKAIEQGLDVLPDNSRLLLGLARLQISQGDLDAAASTYQQGLASTPDNTAFPLGLAGVYEQQGKFDESISIYEQMLETNPDILVAVNNLAALLADHRKDEQSLSKAMELASRLADAEQPALLDTLGWVHYRTGKYDQAVSVLTDVVEKAPDVPVFNYHLGMAYYKQGNKEAAREYLSKAVDEQSRYPGIEEARQVLSEIGGA
ncbi:MAG: tetratricopeptide repeat protein, partial [Pseudomonadota bacterium]|nr:tetratricopeptide repeat protein [Pseudomonadota bacterium]